MADAFSAGNAAFKAGAFDEAVAHFSRAIGAQPDDERIWSNRCAAHLRRGDLDAAEADAARCAELAPRWHKAHYRVGKVQHERGDLVAAWQSYYTAHVLDPALPLYAQMMAVVDERLAAPDAPDAARAELRALYGVNALATASASAADAARAAAANAARKAAPISLYQLALLATATGAYHGDAADFQPAERDK